MKDKDWINFDDLSDVEANKLSMETNLTDLSESKFKRRLWLYKIVSFQGKKISRNIKASKNRTTLTVTNINDFVEFTATPGKELFSYDLSKTYDPNSVDNVEFKNIVVETWVTQHSKLPRFADMCPEKIMSFIDIEDCYIITKEKLTDENFDNVEKMFTTTMDLPDGSSMDLLYFGFNCINIEDWSDQMGVKPIVVINADPVVSSKKIKGLTFSSPTGTFISKIALTTKEGLRPPLLPDENTYIFPKIMFPYQSRPSLELLDWWNSDQFIPFQEIFDYLDSKGIKYNEEFSLIDFLKLGNRIVNSGGETYINNIKTARFDIKGYKVEMSEGNQQNNDLITAISIGHNEKIDHLTYDKAQEKLISVKQFPWFPGTLTPMVVNGIYAFEILNFRYSLGSDELTPFFQEVILEMLNFTYNLKQNFKGATKIEESAEKIDNTFIYNYLKSAQDSQDAVIAITNIFDQWITVNPATTINNKNIIKRAKWVLAALSQDIISNYSYNKGASDDYKLLMPFHLVISNQPELNNANPENNAKPYSDLRVKLMSMYGMFTENEFIFDKKNIAKSKSYQLSTNLISFPDVGNVAETAAIPSMNPADVQLTDGEFYKYMTNKITTYKNYISNYGISNSEYDRYEDISSDGKFITNPNNFEELTISGLQINGNWKIEFEFEDNSLIEFNFRLGNISEDNKGLYILNL